MISPNFNKHYNANGVVVFCIKPSINGYLQVTSIVNMNSTLHIIMAR